MSDTVLLHLCESLYFPRNPRIRCEATRKQYRYALADFGASLGHPAELDDLTDDNIVAMMSFLRERKLATKTINERRGRINALWSWLAKRGITKTWPTVTAIPEPKRLPLAWSDDELWKLWDALGKVQGTIAGIPANLWWRSLHLAAADSAERIGALLKCEWSHLNGNWLIVPAELRKGESQDMAYEMKEDTLSMLAVLRAYGHTQIWPWPLWSTYLWTRYRTIRRKAGLPTDRRSAFHRIRRTVATRYEAAGGNATELLGHSSRAITQKSYLDPRFLKKLSAGGMLFRNKSQDKTCNDE